MENFAPTFSLYHLGLFILRQRRNSAEDMRNPCQNYPTEKFPSYADCDDDFMLRSLPSGLVPFWSRDNISLASNNFNFKKDFRTENIIDKIDWKNRFLQKRFKKQLTIFGIKWIFFNRDFLLASPSRTVWCRVVKPNQWSLKGPGSLWTLLNHLSVWRFLKQLKWGRQRWMTSVSRNRLTFLVPTWDSGLDWDFIRSWNYS